MSEKKFQDLGPGFDAVLPMHLMLNKDVVPQAKSLYAVIRCLSGMNGVCYASNEYLESTFDVNTTTIQRWLNSLEELGYIKSWLNEQGNQRTIEICDDFKNLNRDMQKCIPPPAKMHTIRKNS